jgi:hypothetical protein
MTTRLTVLLLLFLAAPSVCLAEFTLITPSESSNSVAGCADYATEQWRNPWDFSQSSDVPSQIKPLQYANVIEPLSFSNGILRFTSSSDDAHFSLTTPQVPGSIAQPDQVRYGINRPIDTSRYDTLTVRMFTNRDSFFQVYWNGGGTFAITDPVNTTKDEWRTYSLNLATAGINNNGGGLFSWGAVAKEQLRFDPTVSSGADVQIDWMQLTRSESACPQASIQYQSDSGSLNALYVDDDNSISTGIHQHKVITGNGSVQSTDFSTALLFPNSYTVYGYKSDDYATLHGDSWDMNNTGDIDQTRIFNLANARFENGKFCATTTNTDGNFYMPLVLKKPIDAALFKYLTVKLEVSSGSQVTVANVQFFNKSQQALGAVNDFGYDSTNGTVEFDVGASAGWSGEIHSLRIQPTTTAGVDFCIPWIKLSPSAPTTYVEPAVPSLVAAPRSLNVRSSAAVEFVQPDNRGGRDCPTGDFGNPWTMNAQSDIQGLSNISGGEFRPYNQIVDSRGFVRTGDFLRGKGVVGNGDPKVLLLAFSSSLNADRCVHLCYSQILRQSVDKYHSVARMTYLSSAGQGENGDDVINPDRWDSSDVCLYLKELQQEPPLPPGSEHPWKGNINFMSIDPHEDEEGEEFFLDYVEVREEHKADSRFAIVINGATTLPVELYYSTTKPSSPSAVPSGATLITTLAAGRSSNVHLWNTTPLPGGRYYISARIDPLTTSPIVANAPLPIVVDHGSSQDTTPPIVLLDSPTDGRAVTSSLQVAGATFDNIRFATNEFFIDGQYQQAINPSIFHKGARDQHPNLAPNSPGFNVFVDVSGLSAGSHTYKLISYDTAGNSVESTGTFVKGSTATADVTYPDANAAPAPFTIDAKTLSVRIMDGANVAVAASGYEGCTSTAVVASKTSDFSGSVTMFNGSGSLIRTALDLPRWVTSSTTASEARASKKPTPKPKPKCRFVKICKVKKGKRSCRRVRQCTPVKTPTAPPAPTATPTPAPVQEDGVLYFKAQCNGAANSNTVSINFGTEITNAAQTTFETVLLQQLQSKLSNQ